MKIKNVLLEAFKKKKNGKLEVDLLILMKQNKIQIKKKNRFKNFHWKVNET